MKAHLTRRCMFSASHRLHSEEMSEAENRATYGKCNNPFGHGHDYVLEITVCGEVNPATGLLLPIGQLDSFVKEKILNEKRCILIVTHDARINEYADRILHMEDGHLTAHDQESGTE